MKCIKCIKVAKGYELNEIRRVSDTDADDRVKGGYWKFIPKSEWKLSTRKSIKKEVVSEEIAEQVERVKSKKQLKKGK